MKEQNFKNHTRLVTLFHFVGYPLILITLVGAIYKWYRNYSTHIGGLVLPALIVSGSLALAITAWYTRSFALRAQDRAIRAEENLRYFAITGKLLDSKLRLGQIIALRFAPNNEFVDLAHRAVNENLSPKQIKAAIVHWKADHHRV
jgi:L-cystine uptake protein TcyP (sodium:dicarboxylate symporter family)